MLFSRAERSTSAPYMRFSQRTQIFDVTRLKMSTFNNECSLNCLIVSIIDHFLHAVNVW